MPRPKGSKNRVKLLSKESEELQQERENNSKTLHEENTQLQLKLSVATTQLEEKDLALKKSQEEVTLLKNKVKNLVKRLAEV